MTTVRNTARTMRERLVLWLIRRLVPDTPLAVNVIIGPNFGAVRGPDGRSIVFDRVVFDVTAHEQSLVRALRTGTPPDHSVPLAIPELAASGTDTYQDYIFATACCREIGIRTGRIPPATGRLQEEAWAREGPRPTPLLDTVQNWQDGS